MKVITIPRDFEIVKELQDVSSLRVSQDGRMNDWHLVVQPGDIVLVLRPTKEEGK